MTIGSVGSRPTDGCRIHRRVAWLVSALAVLALVVATTAAAAQGRGGAAATSGVLPSFAGISNGTLRLGINPEGHIDAIVDGDEWLGLEYVPTGAEGLINGCWCEGWGVADRNASLSGWASVANGGVSPNLAVTAFDVSADTADSTVEIGGALRVRHRFHPSSRAELYQLDVTVENIGDSLADVVYRRAMDWDVPPTEFSEFVTIQGAHSRLLDSTDYGFQNVNPLLPLYDLGARGTFEDVGPGDVGSVFDFGLGTLAPGASASLTLFYGAASSEADALAALDGRRCRRLFARPAEHPGRADPRDAQHVHVRSCGRRRSDGACDRDGTARRSRRAARSRRRSVGALRSTCRTWTAPPGRRTR